LYAGRGLAQAEMFGSGRVSAKYGVPEHRAGPAYAELALLRGDPSDGLPGVSGIGEKTAARLLTRFGDIRAVRAAAEREDSSLTPRTRSRIVDASDYLDAALPVVRVRTDAPVEWSPAFDRGDAVPHAPAVAPAFEGLAARLGIDSVARRLAEAPAGGRRKPQSDHGSRARIP